ncbi:MAG TPA: DUF222 domain-containing protein, partial [Egibacteraceae bacterium]|nr:DUF222 domain-containing protein [Egibacteraceae bacterium]
MAGPGQSLESERAGEAADRRIAELMGVINAATAELVSVVGEVLATDAWCGAGLRSAAHWVGWRAGLSPARAAVVQMARRAPELPAVMGAFAAGALGEDSVRLIAARAPAHRDAE